MNKQNKAQPCYELTDREEESELHHLHTSLLHLLRGRIFNRYQAPFIHQRIQFPSQNP